MRLYKRAQTVVLILFVVFDSDWLDCKLYFADLDSDVLNVGDVIGVAMILIWLICILVVLCIKLVLCILLLLSLYLELLVYFLGCWSYFQSF